MVLYCPRCRYNLTGLVEHRCPECGTPFDPLMLALTPPWWARPMFGREIARRFFIGPLIVVAHAIVTLLVWEWSHRQHPWVYLVFMPLGVFPALWTLHNAVHIGTRVMLAPDHDLAVGPIRWPRKIQTVLAIIGILLMQWTLIAGLLMATLWTLEVIKN